MDKQEARSIALAHLGELRELTSDLRGRCFGSPQTIESRGPSGVTYQLETSVFWDSNEGGDLRVMVTVDDGGWRSFMPLTEAFIIAPDGCFVGE